MMEDIAYWDEVDKTHRAWREHSATLTDAPAMTITDTPTYPQRAGGLEAALLILRIDLNSALNMLNDGYPGATREYLEASQTLISNALERFGSVTPVSLAAPSVDQR